MKAVLTTINKPNKVYEDLCGELGDSNVIVIGDKKTSSEWIAKKGYISLEEQNDIYGSFSKKLPINHYCRKNIGYLKAIRDKAKRIYETDDDTFLSFGKIDAVALQSQDVIANAGWVNVYKHYSNEDIWPRGLPLKNIETTPTPDLLNGKPKSAIIQYLVDGDPDVDAIYRMTGKLPFYFNKNLKSSLSITSGSLCPYNSQNTIHELISYPLLYLPAHVSFRMTDIWRSIVAQIYLQNLNYAIEFRPPNSIQNRNEHDLIKDLSQEIDGYKYNEIIADTCRNNLNAADAISYLLSVYVDLQKLGIVPKEEVELVKLWGGLINENISV